SAAVEGLLAEVLHPERGIVRAAADLLRQSGVDHLADEDRMVAALHRVHQLALDERRRRSEQRRLRRARAEDLAVQPVAFAMDRLEECERRRLLPFAENV